MKKPLRDKCLVLLLVVVFGSAAYTLLWVSRLPSGQRVDAANFGAFAIALAVAVLATARWLVGRCRPPEIRPLGVIADGLATLVHDRWSHAALEQKLLSPAPVPIQWSISKLPLSGPVTAALGSSAFPPVPGLDVVTDVALRAGGDLHDLHKIGCAIGSGRLIVMGAPGSGKTGAAILFVLASLKHRRDQEEPNRAAVPVPVLLPLHGWDPHAGRSAEDWLVDKLVETYDLFAKRGGRQEAGQLVATGAVIAILDGLDEIPEKLRSPILQALGVARFRIVLLTRTSEMVAVAQQQFLLEAVVLELHHVRATAAADYLERALDGPPPDGWRELLQHIRLQSDSVLTQGLTSPLALTLIRDTFRSDDDVSKLLDLTWLTNAHDVEDHLLARVLPAAYAVRPGQELPKYSVEQAQRTLAALAEQMTCDGTTVLAWWRITGWVPKTPRIVAMSLMFGLGGMLVLGLEFGTVGLKWALGLGLLAGIEFGGGGELPKKAGTFKWKPALVMLAYWFGLMFVVLLVGGLFLYYAAMNAFHGKLPDVMRSSLDDALRTAVAGVTVVEVFIGLPTGILAAVRRSKADDFDLDNPWAVWKANRRYGLVVGLLTGLPVFFLGVLATFPIAGIRDGMVIALAIGFGCTQTWPASLAFVQLAFSKDTVPRLMPFLEDAHHRGVLRTIGPIYQFRHARFQEHLSASFPST